MTDEGGSTGRRTYLRRVALAAAAGLAGCASLDGGTPTEPTAPTATPTDEPTDTPTATPTPTERATPSPTASPTPEPLAAVSGTYPSLRYDAGRRSFVPDATGPVEAPAVAYTLDLPSAVHQPVVDGERLYLAGRRREPDGPTVEAFDLSRGSREWGVDLGSRAVAPPTVAGERVFVQTTDGTYGLAPDGSVVWSSGTVENGGFAPTAVGDRVYAVGEDRLAAYDAAGARRWALPLRTPPIAAPAADESAVYLLVPHDQLTTDVIAFDAEDGATDWRATVPAEHGFPPVRAGDALYLTSDLQEGGVTALAADDGGELWTVTNRLDRGTAVTADRVVFTAGDRVFAHSRSDGSLDWSTPVSSTVVADPVADRDTVYVALDSEDGGSLYALALDGGDGRWRVSFDRPVEAPVVVENGLLVPTRDRADGPERLHVLTRN